MKESVPEPENPTTSADAKTGMVVGQGDSQMRINGTPGSGRTMHMESSKMTMAAFAELISRFVGRPVVDMTELKGNYQVALDLTMDDLRSVASKAGWRFPR